MPSTDTCEDGLVPSLQCVVSICLSRKKRRGGEIASSHNASLVKIKKGYIYIYFYITKFKIMSLL